MSLQLVGIIITILLSAYFAGSETAFLSFNRVRLQAWLVQKRWGAESLNKLVQKPVNFLSTILIGNNLVNVLYSSLLTLYLTKYGVSEKVIFIISPLILLFLGESLPKSIARQTADRIITISAVILVGFRWMLLPVIKITEVITEMLQRSLNVTESDYDQMLTRTDITAVVSPEYLKGLLEPSREALLQQTLRLGLKRVSDIMTHRTSVSAIPIEASISEAREIFVKSGFSRVPCYEGSLDNLVGVVMAKDLLTRQTSLRAVVREITIVPSTLLAIRLPELFRYSRTYIAGVVDEYGGLAGIVTLEDVVEEVVGPILDEHDHNAPRCRQILPNVWMIDGNVKLSQVSYITGIEITADRATSVGGYVNELAGGIPYPGQVFKLDNFRIRVIKSDALGVLQVRLTVMKSKKS